MLWHGHYTVMAVGATAVAIRATADTVSRGVASALQDPTTIALGVAVVVAFVVVRERGLKNEAEIIVLRDEHRDVMARLERGMTDIRTEIRDALERHDNAVRAALTGVVAGERAMETAVALLDQRMTDHEKHHDKHSGGHE